MSTINCDDSSAEAESNDPKLVKSTRRTCRRSRLKSSISSGWQWKLCWVKGCSVEVTLLSEALSYFFHLAQPFFFSFIPLWLTFCWSQKEERDGCSVGNLLPLCCHQAPLCVSWQTLLWRLNSKSKSLDQRKRCGHFQELMLSYGENNLTVCNKQWQRLWHWRRNSASPKYVIQLDFLLKC